LGTASLWNEDGLMISYRTNVRQSISLMTSSKTERWEYYSFYDPALEKINSSFYDCLGGRNYKLGTMNENQIHHNITVEE
jgi:hypothetical protein